MSPRPQQETTGETAKTEATDETDETTTGTTDTTANAIGHGPATAPAHLAATRADGTMATSPLAAAPGPPAAIEMAPRG